MYGHGLSQSCGPTEVVEGTDQGISKALSDSTHTDTVCQKRVSWSQERPERPGWQLNHSRRSLPPVPHVTHSSLQITACPLENEDAGRGRPLQRDMVAQCKGECRSEEGEEEHGERRAGSRASRRSAGMVLLSVWALFGFGSIVNTRYRPMVDPTTSVGTVLTPAPSLSVPPLSPTTLFDTPVSQSFTHLELPYQDNSPMHLQSERSLTSNHIIGRIFAWLCTTLYLTSRLPQIWKNVSQNSCRRAVLNNAGLSMSENQLRSDMITL